MSFLKRFRVPAVVVLACACLLTGCGSNEPEEDLTQVPSGITVHVTEGTVRRDIEETLETNAPEENEASSPAEKIYSLASYTVDSADETSAVVTVSAPDMEKIYFEVFNEVSEGYTWPLTVEASQALGETFEQALCTRLDSGDYPVRTRTVNLKITAGQVQLTEEFADALYGGMLSVRDTLTEQSSKEGN